MRRNLPVTGNEIVLGDGCTIVSKTDIKGVIEEINQDFLDISGFTTEELVNKAHNIVRHPDMPELAFSDLWKDLKAERPWVGMVKNRCKNGDHYWVEAHFSPRYEDGRLIGYMSVRRKATRQAIQEAEAAYARIRNGEPGLTISHGRVVKATWMPRLARRFNLLLRRNHVQVAMQLLALAAVGMLGFCLAQGSAWLALPCGLLAGVLAYALIRETHRRSRRLAALASSVRSISEGNYTASIDILGDGEISNLARSIKAMQVRQGYEIQQIKQQSAANLRIRTALNEVTTSVMIADADLNIIYANQPLMEMLGKAEQDMRHDLPNFDMKTLIGSNIDIFHKHPPHQRKLLGDLRGTHRAQITVGGHVMRQIINPVNDADGKRVGYVVEWADRTIEVQIEKEVSDIIVAASRGDLSGRIRLEDKSGFLLQISEQLNGLLAAIGSSVEQVSNVLRALSQGDLTAQMEGDYRGVFADMRDDANATVIQLTGIIDRIQTAASSIHRAAAEIATGNNDLSHRTEQQAANLEETAASMEELTSTVRQNAEHARQANQLAQDAHGVASQGGDIVGKVVITMSAIEASSKKIADIISVIDGIAFQTNILALNAAVEAARAGEQGRGFAVVASEVRTLAQRSAGAAKEIKDLIGDSVGKVSEGSALVHQAGSTMGEIVSSVQRVTDIMAEISAASQEQSAGIEQVNQTVVQMDEATQQNAALVEEATAAARSMEEQANELASAVAMFRTTSAQAAPTIRPILKAVPQPQASSRARPTPSASTTTNNNEWQEF
ncbi:PAS domain-containing protein [Stenotrophomonas maltophilia]|nr:PAS domain-containing protein [Stenotrophomonas maltophilia]